LSDNLGKEKDYLRYGGGPGGGRSLWGGTSESTTQLVLYMIKRQSAVRLAIAIRLSSDGTDLTIEDKSIEVKYEEPYFYFLRPREHAVD
jgi:hypothetical protein